jgi:geranylgeranyl pyrophosphate synthase
MMVDAKLETIQYVSTPNLIEGFELIQGKLNLVEKLLLEEQPGQHRLMTDAAFQLIQAGGKRIRAAICLLASGIFNANPEISIALAAGVEMLHTATLVHDDIIDESILRRGRPTLNANRDPKLSVLIGDYFFARAANLVAETDNLDIMKQFSATLMTILNGEVNQQFTRWQVDRQEYTERIFAKTGAMFVLAAKSAAILGNATNQDVMALENYGYNIGIAFQMVDDVLDFTSQQTQLGKPVGGDLREGIFTLPVLLYAGRYPEDPDLNLLLKIQDGNHPAVTRLIKSIRSSGVIDESLDDARELVARGQQALSAVPQSEFTEALSALGNTVVERVA